MIDALYVLAFVAAGLTWVCAWDAAHPVEEPDEEPCPVVVLDAHRAARQPGSNVALIRGRK